MNRLLQNDDLGKLILRLTLAVLMLFHGAAKLMNPGTTDFIAGRLSAVGLPGVIAYGVYLGEVIAPLMVALGILCRLGSALIVVNMLFAVALVHASDLLLLTDSGGWRLELQGFFTLCALALVFLGSGRMAVRPD